MDESEAALVRRMFRMYLKERSMPQVAYRLNEEQTTTKTGDEWCTQSVRKVLSNELYIGTYSVAGYEEYVEEYQILSEKIYEKARETRYRFKNTGKMDKNRKQARADEILDQFKNTDEGDTDGSI